MKTCKKSRKRILMVALLILLNLLAVVLMMAGAILLKPGLVIIPLGFLVFEGLCCGFILPFVKWDNDNMNSVSFS